MLGSVYAKTLDDLRGQTLLWSAGLAALGVLNVLVFPSLARIPGLQAFLDNLPPLIKSFAGDVSTMVTPAGFLRVKLLDPLPVLLAVFGVTQGARAIAGEREARTLDLLLAQPVRRWRVVLEKVLAIATALAVMTAALAVALVASRPLADLAVPAWQLIAGALAALPLSLVFTGAALLGSCAFARVRHAAVVAGVLVVASYVLESFVLLSPAVARWRALSLFGYHKASYTLDGHVAAGPVLLLLGLAAGLVAAALLVFQRRDLTA